MKKISSCFIALLTPTWLPVSVALLFCNSVSAQTETYTCAVPVNDMVEVSGLSVKRGQLLKFEATGTVILGGWAGSGGPDGIAGFFWYNLIDIIGHGGLIGQIGSDGDWFFIGSSNEIEALKSGPLILRANDKDNSNNEGTFQVNITVSNWYDALPPCPCQSPDQATVGDGWALDDPSAVQEYHTGAARCFRSYPAVETYAGSSGQQCCYAASGNLIPSGRAAGTPDRESSCEGENADGSMNIWAANAGFHYTEDVRPWNELGWLEYNKCWKPNDCK